MSENGRKGSRKILVIVLAVAAVLIAACAVGLYSAPAARMGEAEKALAAGDFDGAAAIYDELKEATFLGIRLADLPLGRYREAPAMADNARAIKQSSILTTADSLLAENNYAAARSAYGQLVDEALSAERTAASYYAEAEALLAAGEYDQAHETFLLAGSYSDAPARAEAVYVTQAEALLAEDRWADAADAYALAGMPEGRAYCLARAALSAGNLLAAEPLLEAAGTFADAGELLAANADRIAYLKEMAEKRAPYVTLGNAVTFGRYEQNGSAEDGMEPLTWLVARVDGDHVMLVTREVIDLLPVNTPLSTVAWEGSTLHAWLNSAFLSMAFSASERSALVGATTTVTYAVPVGASPTDLATVTDLVTSEDLVTVPGYADLSTLFGDSALLQALGTPYVQALLGLSAQEAETPVPWWVCSGFYSDQAPVQAADGIAWSRVDDRSVGLRPAIWIDLGVLLN